MHPARSMLSLSGDQKAAVIFGMVRAFEASAWPEHFDDDAIATWRLRGSLAEQMLCGGVSNPLDAFAVIKLYDDEVTEL